MKTLIIGCALVEMKHTQFVSGEFGKRLSTTFGPPGGEIGHAGGVEFVAGVVLVVFQIAAGHY